MADQGRVSPRIGDVASRAGTSPITVSRALRQPNVVAPATRARVLEAVEALGYIPDLSASSLASRRSGFVAVLMPTIGNAIFAETFRGVSDAVVDAGLQLFVGDFGYSETRERSLLRALVGRKPEALVLVGVVRDAAMVRLISGLGVPVVETWDLAVDPIDAVVGFSNEGVGRTVGRHLAQGGRRRIGYVGGTDERSAARLRGLCGAVADTASAVTPIVARGFSVGSGREAFEMLLEAEPEIDAVFCASDMLAAGVLFACQRRGIAVPDRMAVVGLGDLDIARELVPALTTVRVPAYEMGRIAGEIVLARRGGDASAKQIVDTGFELIERESS